MDKQTFIDELNIALLKNGVSVADTEGYLRRFEDLIDASSPENREEVIASFGDPEAIAENILEMKAPKAPKAEPPLEEDAEFGTIVNIAPRPKKRPAQRIPQITPKQSDPQAQATSAPVHIDDEEEAQAIEPEDADAYEEDAYEYEEEQSGFSSKLAAIAQALKKPFAALRKNKDEGEDVEEEIEEEPAEEEAPKVIERRVRRTTEPKKQEMKKIQMSQRGKQVFTIGVILTSPIWIALILASAALIAALGAAVLAISALLIIAEVVIIIGGSLLSLVGIVYGIIKLLPGSTVPFVGLYELGLGLMIGGATLVAAVLIYTLLMVGFPFLMKMISRLASLIVKGGKKLVKYVKKECAKL